MQFAVQIMALGLGLGLAALWPRENRPILTRDSAISVAIGAALSGLKFLVGLTGAFEVRLGLLPANLPSPLLEALFAFVLLDLARYWLHRMHHRVPFFWRFHRVHHSVRSLDSTAGFRMHLVDFAQLALLPVLLFGVLLDTRSWASWAIRWIGAV